MVGIFKRVSPSQFAEKVGIPDGWFVLSHHCFPNKNERRSSHGKWYKIQSDYDKVYRIMRFSPRLEFLRKSNSGEIVIDWLAWINLWNRAENVDEPLKLEITKPKLWEYPWLTVSHPDPIYRIAGRLAFLSVVLGIISIILAVCSIFI